MSIVADSVLKELQDAVERSKIFKSIIEKSKTGAKSRFFTKKLEKNNKKVANLLLALDRMEKAQYNTENKE